MLHNLCAVLHPLLFRHFSSLVSCFFCPPPPKPLPRRCFFFPVLFYLVCWLFGTLCGCCLWGFTQILPSNSECTTNLLHTYFVAHHPLPVFSCVPQRCAFNATFCIGFRLACDQLNLGCRYPYSLLSLFLLWLFFSISTVRSFYLVVFPFLSFYFSVFACNKALSS
jgi:hypothetical protein